MILLTASKIEKHFGTHQILEDVSFSIDRGDRIGIVGDNGAGKTTLLSLLSGEDEPSDGTFSFAKGVRIGYLKQSDHFDAKGTVLGEMQAVYEEASSHREEWGISIYESEVRGILTSMGFPESFYCKPISTLSGGERTRLALGSLLLRKPDLLLLDEPTNHLDIGTLKWLEAYLKGYTGTLVIVSHDRYFLDQTVNRIFEINRMHLTAYKGNYSQYAITKKARYEEDLRHYEQQQREIRAEEDKIRWFMGHGTEHLVKRAQSREKRLEHVERLEKPEGENATIRFRFQETFPSGTDVLKLESLSKSFPDPAGKRMLFRGLNIDLKRGEKLAVIGPNGIGKSTLLKMIVSQASQEDCVAIGGSSRQIPDSGKIHLGHNVEIAYYDQEQILVSGTSTVMEEIYRDHRLYTETQVRSLLGRFLFRGDDVFKPVSGLSGGEKARLSLLKIMLTGANFLILDEPTNHLDISSKEIFEDALMEFPGTVLLVSHDRYFLNKVPTRIVELSANGGENYLGKYDYYLEKKRNETGSGKSYVRNFADAPSNAENGATLTKEERQAARQAQKDQAMQIRRLERQREAAEKLADELEARIAELDGLMASASASGNYQRSSELLAEQENTKKALEQAYHDWETAAEALDSLLVTSSDK